MKKVVEIVHDIMKSQLTENSICADFTMGQGYDTLFLAQQKNCSHIYAFDIQPQAYVQTREKLESAQLEGKATLILDSHMNAVISISGSRWISAFLISDICRMGILKS